MEYSPPPLFKQGASARAKVVFFSLIALMLLFIDARLQSLQLVRQLVGSALYPLQMVAIVPRDLLTDMSNYFARLSTLENENTKLKHVQLLQSLAVQQDQQLKGENAQLRKLLGTSKAMPVASVMADILYDARDSFTRRIILNRGSRQGLTTGQPVIDDQGVVGQVTRVFALTSEVTLLTDKDQAIPVQVQRNSLRSVAYGKGQIGALELRVPSNADIKVGDVLVTSGIDGIYPAGLMVARATKADNNASATFERITCLPVAGLDRHKQVLVLLVNTQIEPRPDDADPKPKKVIRHVTRDGPEVRSEPSADAKPGFQTEPKPQAKPESPPKPASAIRSKP